MPHFRPDRLYFNHKNHRIHPSDFQESGCCTSLISRRDLTHWGQVMHICLSRPTRQVIIWTNTGILLIGPLGTKLSEMLIEIYAFKLRKSKITLLLERKVSTVTILVWIEAIEHATLALTENQSDQLHKEWLTKKSLGSIIRDRREYERGFYNLITNCWEVVPMRSLGQRRNHRQR